jgi:hypothetical protein
VGILNYDIPDDLHHRAKARAAMRGESFKALVIRALHIPTTRLHKSPGRPSAPKKLDAACSSFDQPPTRRGLLAGTPSAERAIGYLCKYLTKSIAATHDDSDAEAARVAHIDRLAEEVRWLPCAPTCANWLRYGIQPAGATAGMVSGHCTHKAHDRANLGLGGRRVLVSRKWTGKTLAGHKAHRAAVVRAALEEAGIDPDDHDELSVVGSDGRWSWDLLGRSRVDAPTYAAAIAQVITTRQRWRAQYEAAKARASPERNGSREVSDSERLRR